LSEVPTLPGIDGKGKMSKSSGNAIYLSDDEKEIEKKVRGMYTDPKRIHSHIPGTVEGNPVFSLHDAFNADKEEVESFKKRYREGSIGDVEIKSRLAQAINQFLIPIRERRKVFDADRGYVEKIIYEGTLKMRDIAEETAKEMRSAMGLSGSWNKIARLGREYGNK
jgi:tryptophanyl-tRNA synthetase